MVINKVVFMWNMGIISEKRLSRLSVLR